MDSRRIMPEYLSPGVYVEEFESGPRSIEGVSTSTAGFIGMAERGNDEGLPVLVTNVADFQRKFGGYLSEREYGDKRFLAYAVEHFFINGGSRCYVMRVAPEDAKKAEAKLPICLKSHASNPAPGTVNMVNPLKGAVSIAKDGNQFVKLDESDMVTIDANKLVITFQNPLTGNDSKIKIDSNALKDAANNVLNDEITTDAIKTDQFIKEITLDRAILSGNHKQVTLTFSENIVVNENIELHKKIMVAKDGSKFESLGDSDNAAIKDGKLEITFNNELEGKSTKIKILSGALKLDGTGDPKTNESEIVTGEIDASADIKAPSLIKDKVELSEDRKKVTLIFNEDIKDNMIGDLKTDKGNVKNGISLVITAKNKGAWGNNLHINFAPSSKMKIQFKIEQANDNKNIIVKNSSGLKPGDVIKIKTGNEYKYGTISSIFENRITLDQAIVDYTNTEFEQDKFIETCELKISVKYKDVEETFENVSLNLEQSNYITKAVAASKLVDMVFQSEDGNEMKEPPVPVDESGNTMPPFTFVTEKTEYDKDKNSKKIKLNTKSVTLENGDNGSIAKTDYIGAEDKGPGKRRGIKAFIDNDEVSLMAIPGITDANIQSALVAHCESLGSRFAVLDIPRDKKTDAEVMEHREKFDSNYAAMYNPWLQVFDPIEKCDICIPPSGSVLGIYARADISRGVHKAPANEVIRACTGLDCYYNKGEQDILNPRGVNLIRQFTGEGIRVWGARTCTSNSMWKYINVRRLFIFLEESIKRNTNWVVFEPNDESLWGRVQRTIENFLTTVWRSGALMGASPAEAFFVKVDRSTMSEDDINNGRLICIIGAAPVKPAEFVIFRITQKTSDKQ